ncbi:MAG: metal-sensitive transcriptional regulator [Candidatus Omnitrophica bacterium]|nr:metal-sensitive transcriptional regulator [Candidatus Omnitrophota bacterium]
MKQNPSHQAILPDLKRVEGQVRGVQRMVEEEQYCVDILNQIHAVISALARLEDKILKKHFEHCVAKAVKGASAKEKEQKMREIMNLIHQFRKVN